MKIFTKVISSCETCPNRKKISVSYYGCYAMNGSKIDNEEIIQEWCPLQDLIKKEGVK